MKQRPFLSAEWRHLAMLNYAIDASVLKPFVPPGTELDFHRGTCFVSVVGFLFLHTRVYGWAVPCHGNFEEVNLRFYVHRHTPEGWRRGVVFIRELVPRAAIALIARTVYGEPYTALPMKHSIEQGGEKLRVTYSWRRTGRWESIHASANGRPKSIVEGSAEEFITEHYWGYTARHGGSSEYEVEHPRWQIRTAEEAGLEAEVSTLYGGRFVESLSSPPTSAFIAEGSPILVRRASRLFESGSDFPRVGASSRSRSQVAAGGRIDCAG